MFEPCKSSRMSRSLVSYSVIRTLNSECLLHIMSAAQRNITQIQGRGGVSLVHLDHGHSPLGLGGESFYPLHLRLPNIHWLIKVRHIVSTRLMQLSRFLFSCCLFSFWLNSCSVPGTGLHHSHSLHCVWGAPNFHVSQKDFGLDVLLAFPALNVLW